MSRILLWIVVGAAIMFVLLKILSKTSESTDNGEKLKALLKTQQVPNLMRTNEFRELAKTKEFQRYAASLAKDQIIELSKTLAG
jgi:hypothetical protein